MRTIAEYPIPKTHKAAAEYAELLRLIISVAFPCATRKIEQDEYKVWYAQYVIYNHADDGAFIIESISLTHTNLVQQAKEIIDECWTALA